MVIRNSGGRVRKFHYRRRRTTLWIELIESRAVTVRGEIVSTWPSTTREDNAQGGPKNEGSPGPNRREPEIGFSHEEERSDPPENIQRPTQTAMDRFSLREPGILSECPLAIKQRKGQFLADQQKRFQLALSLSQDASPFTNHRTDHLLLQDEQLMCVDISGSCSEAFKKQFTLLRLLRTQILTSVQEDDIEDCCLSPEGARLGAVIRSVYRRARSREPAAETVYRDEEVRAGHMASHSRVIVSGRVLGNGERRKSSRSTGVLFWGQRLGEIDAEMGRSETIGQRGQMRDYGRHPLHDADISGRLKPSGKERQFGISQKHKADKTTYTSSMHPLLNGNRKFVGGKGLQQLFFHGFLWITLHK
uniref:Uncharacterized protein n=1 Tax=Steinernema glaseri TaxID=37863 RepID=A0A1I7ZQJ5_9BILA